MGASKSCFSDESRNIFQEKRSEPQYGCPPNVYNLSKNAYVLVFHNDEFQNNAPKRNGSEKDLEALREFFVRYKKSIIDVQENQTEQQIQQKMQQISQKDFTDYSCLIVFIMSHGGANGTIMASDGELYSFENDVLHRCASNRTLDGKPKLFILQVCRGDGQAPSSVEQSICNSLPQDVAIFQSTNEGAIAILYEHEPGSDSYRDSKKGSFFIQYLLTLLHEHRRLSIDAINYHLLAKFQEKGVKPVQSANTYDLSKNAYVLVFHHYSFKDKRNNREGSTRDMQKIRQVFNHYRCDALDVNENKTVAQVERKMMEIKDKDFTKHSCLIVFIMSHGSVNDDILAHDGKWYNFQKDVVEFCTANRTLKEKPKMFVLQACRGDARIVADATPSMSHKIDLIIFQSSYQGSDCYKNTTVRIFSPSTSCLTKSLNKTSK
uniref:Caspase family p20 domain-containing protein n=1 Tax=Anopheles epiroticus TaxID=199890 RepID=A0A182P1T6_9DIPT